jgi:hypothetical protein
VGRQAFVQFISGAAQGASDADPLRTTWDVHRVAYTADGRWAFARITAHVPRSDGSRELLVEQTLAYGIDEDGLISGIEVFWRDPRS